MMHFLFSCLWIALIVNGAVSSQRSSVLRHRLASNNTWNVLGNDTVTVCHCDNIRTCIDESIMSKEDEIFICISTTALTIANIESLSFHQEGLSVSTIVEGTPDDYTWVVKSRNKCQIRTRVMDHAFFKPSFRGNKRTSLAVQGIVTFEGNDAGSKQFEMEIPLKTTRLISYVAKNSYVFAFGGLLLIFIGVWAAIVAWAKSSRRYRLEVLTPEKVKKIQERRATEIYTIWHQSTSSWKEPVTSLERVVRSPRLEEEKQEIESYEHTAAALHIPPEYALNNQG